MSKVRHLAKKSIGLLLSSTLYIPASGSALANEFECSTYQTEIQGIPVNITDCREISSEEDIFEKNFFSFSAPFSLGVSMPYQLSDILGLSVKGEQGTLIKAFGFPEQKIDWDGTALSNTFKSFMSKQSRKMPIRTAPIGNGFCEQLSAEYCINSAED